MGKLQVVIIGGRGTAVNIAEQIVDAARRFALPLELHGFAIDDPALGNSIDGYPVLCGTRETFRLFSDPSIRVIYCLYKPDCMRERVALLRSLQIPPDRFATFVHPSAYVGTSALVGNGSVILANAAIQSKVTIGPFCVVNSNVVVEHDTVVGSNSFIASGVVVGSHVRIGEGGFLGLNCTVREATTVGDYAFIGMGANVIHEVESGSVVFGNPASTKK